MLFVFEVLLSFFFKGDDFSSSSSDSSSDKSTDEDMEKKKREKVEEEIWLKKDVKPLVKPRWRSMRELRKRETLRNSSFWPVKVS